MTCIVSTVSSQYAVLASDSGITWDNIKATPTNKIVQQGTWLIGAAGADRVCDVVQFGIKYPIVPKTVNLDDYNEAMKFMVTKVVPLIRDAMSDEQSLKTENGVAGIPDDSYFTLVTHGKSFTISETLGVSVNRDYSVIGSGTELAMGYLAHGWKDPEWVKKHDQHAAWAVEAAIKHDTYCGAPVMAYKSFPSGEVKMYRKGVGTGTVEK
jgi:20S proteasome alpha/beta subunit